MRKLAYISLLIIAVMLPADNVAGKGSLAPGLAELADRSASVSDSTVRIVVFMEDQSDKLARTVPLGKLSRGERIKRVTANLKSARAYGSEEVYRFLRQNAQSEIKRHWITPAFSTSVPVSSLNYLAAMEGVRLVVENVAVTYIEPVEVLRADNTLSTAVSQPLYQLKVPALWQKGLTGKGRIVCSFDTGVKYDHEALLSKWRGNHAALSAAWFSKVAPTTVPADAVGHGTHTMGIMVGSAGADTIGVAPDAEWITAGVIDQGRPLSTTIADILEAFQWALDPDGNPVTTSDVPDVILNSWGIPKGLFAPCDGTFSAVVENVEAAGVVTIFAAGNEGPTPMSLRNPGDMALTPLCAFAVGAVDNYSIVAGFSSRGPASCDQITIKPELVAPGVGIRSSYKDGSYRVLSGTSMAAPYVAGLVALMRQYNPNATVDQIKAALMAAASDLGAAGEDNDYGFGLVDASRLLEFLPNPAVPEFVISRATISGDGLAMPGEHFYLQIALGNAAGNVETVNAAVLSTAASGVNMIAEQSAYLFAGDHTSAVNSTPFEMVFEDTLYNGQDLPFELVLSYDSGRHADTLSFNLEVGLEPTGRFATHATRGLNLTVSDFGMFGLAPGSIYNVRGDGFRVAGSSNILYEAGIILARNALQLSSSIRGPDGGFSPTDFAPTNALTDEWVGSDGGSRRTARYNDRSSDIPIPITVRQETISFPSLSSSGLLIVKIWLQNTTVERISDLNLGLLVDYDLVGEESVAYDSDLNMILQSGDGGPQGAVVGLSEITSFKVFDNNETSKRGFTKAELFDIISRPGIELDAAQTGDRFFIVCAGPFSIPARDSVEVSFAFVGGLDQNELYANATAARQMYDQATGADDDGLSSLPASYELNQNYPNPFNPSTTIEFALPKASDVSLRIYNTLGQVVATLQEGRLAAGQHTFDWNPSVDLASGIYFYRLVADGTALTRKMVLVK